MIDFSAAYPNSRKVYESRTVSLTPGGTAATLQVPMREVSLSGGEPPLRLYDTSGPVGHDVRDGLPKLREPWIAARRATGTVGTQLYYARRGEITPEMESSPRGRVCRRSWCAPRSRGDAPSFRRTSTTWNWSR